MTDGYFSTSLRKITHLQISCREKGLSIVTPTSVFYDMIKKNRWITMLIQTKVNLRHLKQLANRLSPEVKKEENDQLKLIIGNYFASITVKKSFWCENDEDVYDCLNH